MMTVLRHLFKSSKPEGSASVAKERLQVLVSHQRLSRLSPDFIPELKQDIIKVIGNYILVTDDTLSIRMEKEGDLSILEVNVQLPDAN